MASIVSCPGCQKRLKIGTDKPGGKLRCPACNTPFVLGSRIGGSSGGTAEFQAFELFEEDVVIDTFEIEEERPQPRPLPKSSTPKSAPTHRPTPLPSPPPPPPLKSAPKPPPTPVPAKGDDLLPDDLDLLEEGPLPPRPAPKPKAPAKDEPLLPDDFGFADDRTSRPAAKSAEPAAKAPSAEGPLKPLSEPAPDFFFEPRLEALSAQRAAKKARSEAKPEPEVKPKPAPAKGSDDFFLPADFDPFAAPAPKPPLPDLSLDDDTPKLKDDEHESISQDFEIVEERIRTAADGVAVVEGATDEEITEFDYDPLDEDDVNEVGPAARVRRRERRRARARKHGLQSDKHGRWTLVYWGVTIELAALAMLVLAGAFGAFSFFLLIVARAMIAPMLLLAISAVLLALREILVMVGYGLCIPAPTKNMAWLWAVLALAFAVASLFGYIVALIFPPAFFIMPLTIISWFFYLIYIKNVAEALKINYLADESMNLMKLLGIMLTATFVVWIAMFVLVVFVAPHSVEDMTIVGLMIATCSCVFTVFAIIMAAIIIYKYYYILLNLRQEIGWRLES